MEPEGFATWAALAVLAGAGLFGAVSDLRTRTIPNWLSLITLIAGLLFAGMIGGLGALGSHAAHAVAALVVTIGLFAMRWWGGGDAKFYTAVAAWFPLQEGLILAILVALSGAVLVIVHLAVRRGSRSGNRDKSRELLPYGVAIAIGAILTATLPIAGVTV